MQPVPMELSKALSVCSLGATRAVDSGIRYAELKRLQQPKIGLSRLRPAVNWQELHRPSYMTFRCKAACNSFAAFRLRTMASSSPAAEVLCLTEHHLQAEAFPAGGSSAPKSPLGSWESIGA